MKRRYIAILAGLILLAAFLTVQITPQTETTDTNKKNNTLNTEKKETDILAKWGFKETGGTIPGYIEDRACSAAGCHEQLCKDFEKTDKNHSFGKSQPEKFLADFNKTYYHKKSKRYYRINKKNNDLFFQRWQKDEKGKTINELELKVSWLHGAATLVRAYIYQAPCGELYQMPVVWYSQLKEWKMGPGFDIDHHIGIRRLVHQECQFCHNGYTELPANADHIGAPQAFPKNITEGIGCQRCHGPGAKHTRLGLLALEPNSTITTEQLQQSIINPERLSPKLQDDSCNQCHERTAKTVSPIYRFGRGVFSYKPGEPLADYMLMVHVSKEGPGLKGRIGAVSQPARTRKSRCYIKSGGALNCIDCHDSHRKIPHEERPAHYRAACLKCHESDDCGDNEIKKRMAAGGKDVDCVKCHMPKRPSTVADFPITEHWIVPKPPTDVPPEPLTGKTPIINDARVLDIKGELADLYRTAAVVHSGRYLPAVEHLKKLVTKLKPKETEPYLILARGYAKFHKWNEAKEILDTILKRDPENVAVYESLAMVLYGLGRKVEAIRVLREVALKVPNRPEIPYNLGLFLMSMGRYNDAMPELRKAVEMRPIFVLAWYYLGNGYVRMGKTKDALECFKRSVALEPRFGRGYLELGKILLTQGKRKEARRYWRHGASEADEPEPLKKVLEKEFGTKN